MSVRSSRISQDFAALKKLLNDGDITQLVPMDPNKKSIDHVGVILKGPKGTVYQGGVFKIEIKFPSNYPNQPPFVRLHTPIWHPNIILGFPIYGEFLA